MYILGISLSVHDSAACILRNGRIIAFMTFLKKRDILVSAQLWEIKYVVAKTGSFSKEKKLRCNKIPFNFGSSLFSLQGDLYDRFSALIEHRFSRQEVYAMFIKWVVSL